MSEMEVTAATTSTAPVPAVQPGVINPQTEPDYATDLNNALQSALAAYMQQDGNAARNAADLANGIFEDAKLLHKGEDLFFLDLIRGMACLFAYLTDSAIAQAEGRHEDAIKRLDAAIALSSELNQSIVDYKLSPLCDPQALAAAATIEPVLRPYPPLLDGMRANVIAETALYKGNLAGYAMLLESAATAFRGVKKLTPSANPVFRMLVASCNNQADRCEARRRNLEPQLKEIQYSVPNGNQIFIIHGQNEGKRRELVDLLKERGFDPLVLVDTTSSSAVLIDKFTSSAAKCAYAIALFTPDDFVSEGDAGIRQARPNVLFELGWFYGRFGPGRTLIVKQQGTAIPSDLAGILSQDFIKNVSEVIDSVAKELAKKCLMPASGAKAATA